MSEDASYIREAVDRLSAKLDAMSTKLDREIGTFRLGNDLLARVLAVVSDAGEHKKQIAVLEHAEVARQKQMDRQWSMIKAQYALVAGQWVSIIAFVGWVYSNSHTSLP